MLLDKQKPEYPTTMESSTMRSLYPRAMHQRRCTLNTLRSLFAAWCLSLFSLSVSAAPINYSFSGSFQGSGTFTLDVAGASFSSTIEATNVNG